MPATSHVQRSSRDGVIALIPLLREEMARWPRTTERLRWFHEYYANPMSPVPADDSETSDRFYRQAQERGLPRRITGARRLLAGAVDPQRKEVVVENDIAWRVDTMTDVMLGRSPLIESTAVDVATREMLSGLLRAVMDGAGGGAFLQDLATSALVFGFADVVVKASEGEGAGLRLELVDALSALPLRDPLDARRLEGYARVIDLPEPACDRLMGAGLQAGRPLAGLEGPMFSGPVGYRRLIEVYFTGGWGRLLDGRLLDAGESASDGLPVVRFTNLPTRDPWHPRGEVEPLIPMQDELNVRLSDRAYRMALTSAPMFLAAGVNDVPRVPLGPGRVWSTDNAQAKVMTFGGDPGTPTEDRHIDEVREAMDKISGVSPIAAGAIKQKLGNLTSAAALRVTLQSLTTKTIRRRASFGAAIGTLARLVFQTLAAEGRAPNRPEDWGTEVLWGPILPEDASEQLAQARAKIDLGLPARVVLKELGYDLPEATGPSAAAST